MRISGYKILLGLVNVLDSLLPKKKENKDANFNENNQVKSPNITYKNKSILDNKIKKEPYNSKEKKEKLSDELVVLNETNTRKKILSDEINSEVDDILKEKSKPIKLDNKTKKKNSLNNKKGSKEREEIQSSLLELDIPIKIIDSLNDQGIFTIDQIENLSREELINTYLLEMPSLIELQKAMIANKKINRKHFSVDIEDLGFSNSSIKRFESNRIFDLYDLIGLNKEQILQVNGYSQLCFSELLNVIKLLDLTFPLDKQQIDQLISERIGYFHYGIGEEKEKKLNDNEIIKDDEMKILNIKSDIDSSDKPEIIAPLNFKQEFNYNKNNLFSNENNSKLSDKKLDKDELNNSLKERLKKSLEINEQTSQYQQEVRKEEARNERDELIKNNKKDDNSKKNLSLYSEKPSSFSKEEWDIIIDYRKQKANQEEDNVVRINNYKIQNTSKTNIPKSLINKTTNSVTERILVENLGLDSSTISCLWRNEINDLYDLVNCNKDNLLSIKNFGIKRLLKLEKILFFEFGLKIPFTKNQLEIALGKSIDNYNENKSIEETKKDYSLIENIGLDPPTVTTLMRSRKYNLYDLAYCNKEDLLAIKNFGPQRLKRLEKCLLEMGLKIPYANHQVDIALGQSLALDTGSQTIKKADPFSSEILPSEPISNTSIAPKVQIDRKKSIEQKKLDESLRDQLFDIFDNAEGLEVVSNSKNRSSEILKNTQSIISAFDDQIFFNLCKLFKENIDFEGLISTDTVKRFAKDNNVMYGALITNFISWSEKNDCENLIEDEGDQLYIELESLDKLLLLLEEYG